MTVRLLIALFAFLVTQSSCWSRSGGFDYQMCKADKLLEKLHLSGYIDPKEGSRMTEFATFGGTSVFNCYFQPSALTRDRLHCFDDVALRLGSLKEVFPGSRTEEFESYADTNGRYLQLRVLFGLKYRVVDGEIEIGEGMWLEQGLEVAKLYPTVSSPMTAFSSYVADMKPFIDTICHLSSLSDDAFKTFVVEFGR